MVAAPSLAQEAAALALVKKTAMLEALKKQCGFLTARLRDGYKEVVAVGDVHIAPSPRAVCPWLSYLRLPWWQVSYGQMDKIQKLLFQDEKEGAKRASAARGYLGVPYARSQSAATVKITRQEVRNPTLSHGMHLCTDICLPVPDLGAAWTRNDPHRQGEWQAGGAGESPGEISLIHVPR
jgi:hypothetical protein